MNKSHVIFDFDGVICDSLGPAIRWYNRIREERFPLLPQVTSKEDMVTVYSGPLRTSLASWLTPNESELFFDLHSAAMAAEAANLSTYPGICAAMAALGPGRSSVVTSAYSAAVLTVLHRDPDFDDAYLFSVAGRELRQSKAEKIARILTKLGVSASEAIYVGDLESDILYCRDLPIDIICVGYGYHPAAYLKDKGATYVVESVDELSALLTRIFGLQPPPSAAT